MNKLFLISCFFIFSVSLFAQNQPCVDIDLPPPVITSSTSNALCQGESITLIATNCQTGTLQWSTGATANVITVTPVYTTTFSASCILGECKASSYIGIAVLPKPRIDTIANKACNTIALIAENTFSNTSLIWKKDTVFMNTNEKKIVVTQAGAYSLETDILGGWASQSGEVTHQPLNDVMFVNDLIGITVGNRGIILKTSDGGDNWQPVLSNTTASLNRIAMPSESIFWAVGIDGIILKTVDGGSSWQRKRIATDKSLLDLSFISPTTGWVITGQEIFYTYDGGTTWVLQYTHPTATFKRIQAVTPSGIVVIGANGTVLYSADTGASWVASNSGTVETLTDIAIREGKDIWAIGNNAVLLRSKDGGINWTRQSVAPTFNTLSATIQFTSNSVGWIFTVAAGTYKTTDAGESWQLIISSQVIQAEVKTCFMKNDKDGIGVNFNWFSSDEIGFTPMTIAINKTTNGGVFWRPVNSGLESNYNGGAPFSDIHFISNEEGFAIQNMSIFRTTNKGKTWKKQQLSLNTSGFTDIFFVNNTHGWLIGRPSNNGCIATVDGGQTWTVQNLPTNNFNDLLHNIYFINPLEGWIVGANGIIFKTTDGGNNWIRKISNTNYRLISIHFLNSLQGCAVGENGIILTTTDGGESWVTQKSNTTERFLSVQYTTSLIGWAAGDNLYKTINGGKTWLKQSIEPTVVNSFRQVQFQDEYNGWVLGSVDAFFTNDGGLRWSKAPHLTNPKKIHFYSPTEGWIAGNNIMKYQSVNGCTSDLVAIPALTGPAQLQTVNSGNWESPASWNCGVVPTVIQDVIIKSSHRIYINPLHPAKCKNIFIEPGAVLNCPTGASFEAKSWN